MALFSLILASLFTFYTAFVNPWLGNRRYQTLPQRVAAAPNARAQYYRRNVVNKWLWLTVIGIILLIGSIPLSEIGLLIPQDLSPTFWLLLEIVILLPIVLVIQLRIIKKNPRARGFRLILAARELFPRTSQERRLWILMSITAGVCEEIVFRGFFPVYFLSLGNFFGLQISYLTAAIISAALFGFAHLYQGWKGMLATGLLGAVFAFLYSYTGSLILPIIAHILIDARLVFLVPAILNAYDKQPENI